MSIYTYPVVLFHGIILFDVIMKSFNRQSCFKYARNKYFLSLVKTKEGKNNLSESLLRLAGGKFHSFLFYYIMNKITKQAGGRVTLVGVRLWIYGFAVKQRAELISGVLRNFDFL